MSSPRNKEVDKSSVVWRSAAGGLLLAITGMVTAVTNKILYAPDNSQVQQSIQQLSTQMDKRVSAIEGTVQQLSVEVQFTRGMVEALRPQLQPEKHL